MQIIERALISFFVQVAQKDKAQLIKIRQEKTFSVGETGWYFTLPDLYFFLMHQNDIFRCIDYKQFRQIVFNSSINMTVKSHGAEISIADNRGKVDKSSYVLVWKVET